jgi:DNA-binding transcriptional LysR family regulator
MKLSRINLNLLVVLDVLLQEKHVTKASEKLHVTQSTVSTALNQLREMFKDELLIREKNNMVLTPKAQFLATKIHNALSQLNNIIFNEVDFNPSTAEITFRMAMDDCLECLLLPELNHYLSTQAPGIKCEIQHATVLNEHLFVGSNAIDLGIGMLHSETTFLKCEKLFAEHFVCVGRQDHPLLKKALTLDKYLKAEHLSLYSPLQQHQDMTDIALNALGKTRNIVLNVTHVSTALYLLMNSNLVATIPFTLVNKAKPIVNLGYQELPFHIADVPIFQVWHSQFDNDIAHRWMQSLIKNILQDSLKQFQYKLPPVVGRPSPLSRGQSPVDPT